MFLLDCKIGCINVLEQKMCQFFVGQTQSSKNTLNTQLAYEIFVVGARFRNLNLMFSP